MKIKPFCMKVTIDESVVVQKILFEKGYSWIASGHEILYLSSNFIMLMKQERYPNKLYIYCARNYTPSKDAPLITFEQFNSEYTKEQRKKKLERLNQCVVSEL